MRVEHRAKGTKKGMEARCDRGTGHRVYYQGKDLNGKGLYSSVRLSSNAVLWLGFSWVNSKVQWEVFLQGRLTR